MRNFLKFMPVILLSMGMAIFYISCQKETPVIDNNVSVRTASDGDGETDPMVLIKRLELTEVISIAICKKPIIKDAIKASVSDFMYTHSYYENEMFFNLEKDKPSQLLGGKSIAQTLALAVPDKPVADIIQYLCTYDPGLAILMEGNLNSSKTSNQVFIDDNFDDSNLNNEVHAFECGTSITKTIKHVEYGPDLFFIVRESEAYSGTNPGGTEFRSLGSACNNAITVIGSSINEPDYSGPTIETRSVTCIDEWRDIENGKENLYRYKTDKDFDPMKGHGEFLEYCLFAEDIKYKFNQETGVVDITGHTLDFVVKRQEGVKRNFQWKEVNADLFRWDPAINGYKYKLVWFEDDGGKRRSLIKKVTLTAKVKLPDGTAAEGSVSADFEGIPNFLSDGDDFIGENIIDYCDPKSFLYTPTSLSEFQFNVNER